jgi:hypothetical protein
MPIERLSRHLARRERGDGRGPRALRVARTSFCSSSSVSTRRARPAAIARQASVASWQVNVD